MSNERKTKILEGLVSVEATAMTQLQEIKLKCNLSRDEYHTRSLCFASAMAKVLSELFWNTEFNPIEIMAEMDKLRDEFKTEMDLMRDEDEYNSMLDEIDTSCFN